MIHKSRFYVEQFKTRKVFKNEIEYVRNDSHRGVSFVGSEVERFPLVEKGIRILGYLSFIVFVLLVVYSIFIVFVD